MNKGEVVVMKYRQWTYQDIAEGSTYFLKLYMMVHTGRYISLVLTNARANFRVLIGL